MGPSIAWALFASWALWISVAILSSLSTSYAHHIEVNITVPESYKVQGNDAYVCTVVELPVKAHKLIGVVPLAEQAVVHHILLFGCMRPFVQPVQGRSQPVWDCMGAPICADGASSIIYGWGRNAPHLELPEGVGFSVGAGTSIHYVVAQVHFTGPRPNNDASGVALLLKPHPVPYAGGLLSFASGFQIPPGAESHLISNECCYRGHQPLTTFAFRVHTHTLGRSVDMKREAWNHSGTEVVAVNDPQLPQAFYPVKQQVIWPGDRLKVTCDFDSTSRTTVTYAGPTHKDEMCNMYMMVYAPHPTIVMCADSSFAVSDATPGTMPRGGSLIPDPCPFWQPPAPAGGALGDITSITIDAHGMLWGLYRGSRHWVGDTFAPDNRMTDRKPIPEAVVVQMDPDTGKVLKSWGANTFSMPHTLTVDMYGHVWVADVGRHQVLKFDAEGKLLLAVGQELEPGAGKERLCKPTQVAVLRDGSFLVSDGYCNQRVVMYSAAGEYTGEFAVPGPPGAVVHSVLVDECASKVYVAAREAGKVYTFRREGEDSSYKLAETHDLSSRGRVWALLMGPYGSILAMTWELGKAAQLVNLDFGGSIAWTIPGMQQLFPHGMALGAAPVELSGAGDRLFALYVAPTCGPPGCGPLRRFVLAPPGWTPPNATELAAAYAARVAHAQGQGHAARAPEAAAGAAVGGGGASGSGAGGSGVLTAAIEKAEEQQQQREAAAAGGASGPGPDGKPHENPDASGHGPEHGPDHPGGDHPGGEHSRNPGSNPGRQPDTGAPDHGPGSKPGPDPDVAASGAMVSDDVDDLKSESAPGQAESLAEYEEEEQQRGQGQAGGALQRDADSGFAEAFKVVVRDEEALREARQQQHHTGKKVAGFFIAAALLAGLATLVSFKVAQMYLGPAAGQRNAMHGPSALAHSADIESHMMQQQQGPSHQRSAFTGIDGGSSSSSSSALPAVGESESSPLLLSGGMRKKQGGGSSQQQQQPDV